jgi:hypothetical protein
MSVTKYGFWINDLVYWTLWYSALTALYNSLLHTHTIVPSHVFTSRCSVAASNGRHSPSSGFPNYPLPQLSASHSNGSQWLNLSSSLTNSLTNSVTHQPTNSIQLSWFSLTILLITSQRRPHRKHRSIIAEQLVPWKHACLWSRYIVTTVVQLLLSHSCLATGLHATIPSEVD